MNSMYQTQPGQDMVSLIKGQELRVTVLHVPESFPGHTRLALENLSPFNAFLMEYIEKLGDMYKDIGSPYGLSDGRSTA